MVSQTPTKNKYTDRFTVTDKESIPTGELRSVKNSNFDFLNFHKIGERIDDTNEEQLVLAKGYDHNFVINQKLFIQFLFCVNFWQNNIRKIAKQCSQIRNQIIKQKHTTN